MKFKLKNEKFETDILKLVCENRNVDYSKLDRFLNPGSEEVSNPNIYKNMEELCQSIIIAIKEGLNIGVLIDSDADGYCSSAMLINYFKDVLNYSNINIFIHEEKEHGLTPYIMNEIKNSHINVLIIPDAGSNNYKQHEELYMRGIEVLVIDHHEFDKETKFAKIVNNQGNNIDSNKTLSGGGMVLKVLEHLDYLTNNSSSQEYYDLAAVSLVADSMLMTQAETRYYVQQGLKYVNNNLLQELYKADGTRSFESISYDIAPTINAFIRIGTMSDKRDLFAALIGAEYTKEIVVRGAGTFELPIHEYVSKMATRLKSTQTREITKALDSSNTFLNHENLPIVICILDNATPKTLTGLIGNRLVDKYKKPALILKEMKNNNYGGSGRTTDTFVNFKDYLTEFNLFDFIEGHQGAFGTSISSDNLKTLMSNIAGTNLGDQEDLFVVDKSYVDIVSAYDIITISDLNNYWAKGFNKPLFHIKLNNVKDKSIQIIGRKKDTIKIVHNNITYIKFKCKEEEIAEISSYTNIDSIEFIGTFDVNEWMDTIYPQVMVNKLEIVGSKTEQEIKSNDKFAGMNFLW